MYLFWVCRLNYFLIVISFLNFEGARIGNNDLRLKLLRKRMSKQILETEERKKKQMQAKMSGISQSTQQYERIRSTDTPLPRRVPLDLAASDGLRTRSPNRVLKDSREVASSRNINEFQRVPLTRPVDATRTRLMGSDPANPSRSNFPAPAMLGVANGSVPRSSYLVYTLFLSFNFYHELCIDISSLTVINRFTYIFIGQ